jgi:hypothetical protein
MTDPDRSVWPLALAVRRAGRLLCWSLGAGMATAAIDFTVAPRASRWPALWPLPWYTTAASALLWAVLRAREKYVLSSGDDDPQTNEEVYAEWDQAA